jgi:hypothetical protein
LLENSGSKVHILNADMPVLSLCEPSNNKGKKIKKIKIIILVLAIGKKLN